MTNTKSQSHLSNGECENHGDTLINTATGRCELCRIANEAELRKHNVTSKNHIRFAALDHFAESRVASEFDVDGWYRR